MAQRDFTTWWGTNDGARLQAELAHRLTGDGGPDGQSAAGDLVTALVAASEGDGDDGVLLGRITAALHDLAAELAP